MVTVKGANLLREWGYPEEAIASLPPHARVSRFYWDYGAPKFQYEKGDIAITGASQPELEAFRRFSRHAGNWQGKGGGFLRVRPYGKVPGIVTKTQRQYVLPPPHLRPGIPGQATITFDPTQKNTMDEPAIATYKTPTDTPKKFYVRPLTQRDLRGLAREEAQGKDIQGELWHFNPPIMQEPKPKPKEPFKLWPFNPPKKSYVRPLTQRDLRRLARKEAQGKEMIDVKIKPELLPPITRENILVWAYLDRMRRRKK
jgi:hypothetical protein